MDKSLFRDHNALQVGNSLRNCPDLNRSGYSEPESIIEVKSELNHNPLCGWALPIVVR